MKTLFLVLVAVLINQPVYAVTCYLYDSGYNQVLFGQECSAIDKERAIDEGLVIFSNISTKYYDGCLMAKDSESPLFREYNEYTCEEALDEGYIVMGESL